MAHEMSQLSAYIGTLNAARLATALRRAAAEPDAPARLHRAADAVLDGKFSWDDVVAGRCTHPYALSLFTRGAEREMWPRVLGLLAEEAHEDPKPAKAEDFSEHTYLNPESW